MQVEIYSKDNCSFCTRAIKFLTNKKIPYTEHKLDRDVSIDEIKQNFPLQKTFPIILIDGNVIGGYTDLVEISTSEYFGLQLLKG